MKQLNYELMRNSENLEQLEQLEQSLKQGNGNTNPPVLAKQSREVQALSWCYTLNNYTPIELEQLEQWSIKNCKKYIIGKEIGECGTPHLQGFFVLKSKKRMSTLINELNNNRYHWEKARNIPASARYCAKEGNYIQSGFREFELEPVNEYTGQDLPKLENLYEWQKEAFDLLKNPTNGRKVYWIYETDGNVGKTLFSKFMAWHYNTLIIQKGKYSDIMNMAYNMGNKLKTFILDIPRSSGNSVSYNAIESIKSGIIVNTKYETGQCLILPVNIMIFANSPPDLSQLSMDRWNIYKIQDNKLNPISIETIQKLEEI